MDLRVVKTKRAIKGALTDLCASKPLAEVTVKELCSRAEVSKPRTDARERIQTIWPSFSRSTASWDAWAGSATNRTCGPFPNSPS